MTYAIEISKKFGTPHDQDRRRIVKRYFLEFFEKFESKSLSRLASFLFRNFRRNSKSRISISLRFLLTRFYKFDPLENMKCEKFSLAILTSPKDIEILAYSLASIVEIYKEEIEEIFIVFPESLLKEVAERVEFLDLNMEPTLITDERVIDKYIAKNFKFSSTVPKMESIKLCLPSLSNSENMLVVDGDTIYLKKRVWRSKNSICQVVAQEYMSEHINFHKDKLNLKCNSGLGFVTHHSFFIRSEIDSIRSAWGGMQELAMAIDSQFQQGFDSGAFPSEWQMYGDWIFEQKKYKFEAARFDNLGISREALPLVHFPDTKVITELLFELKSAVPNLGSLSLHDYK